MDRKLHWRQLRPEEVRRVRVAAGTVRQVAARYGIGRTQVSNIRRRRAWKAVD
jgi:homoserine acetyltransferase